MAGLNPKYITTSDLQTLLRDKDTGLPLRGGKIYFYQDTSRTTLKNIYELVDLPSYNYQPLPNPLTLSSAGTVADDDGNDIIIYYWPWEGDPAEDSSVLDLYFIKVFNSDDIEQFTRSAWPNSAIGGGSSGSTTEFENYVPNGQFLLHNDLPVDGTNVAGQIRAPITAVAPGGWTFERSDTSTATDIVTFTRYDAYIDNQIPPANPRYAINIQNQVVGANNDFKDLRLKFDDVNFFAYSSADTETGAAPITLRFNARSTGAGTIPLDIDVYKYYGSGGSAPDRINQATFTITLSEAAYEASFFLGDNDNKTIGPNDDDYVQIVFSLPVDAGFSIEITDVAIAEGDIASLGFPDTSPSQTIAQASGGYLPLPAYDGSDLYLPAVWTQSGWIFDDSCVGEIKTLSYRTDTMPASYRYADGTQVDYLSYSTEGVPYSRLGDKYWYDAINAPIHGTGDDYVTAGYPGDTTATDNFNLICNTTGAVTAASAGTVTGFTFAVVSAASTALNMFSWAMDTGILAIQSNSLGAPTVQGSAYFAAGTTTFTASYPNYYIPTSTTKQRIYIECLAASAITGGQYFNLVIKGPSGDLDYYVWFTKDGGGSDPAPGGTGILVPIITGDDSNTVAAKIAVILNGFDYEKITTPAASGITGGQWFQFFATDGSVDTKNVVWYEKAGVGTEPVVASTDYYIKVVLAGTETAPQVAEATTAAINKRFYKVPDLRGVFLRGWANASTLYDPNRLARIRPLNGIVYAGDNVGTYQLDDNLSHTHDFLFSGEVDVKQEASSALGFSSTAPQEGDIGFSGNVESRPVNAYVNYIIKY
jgi:hypothetical protein